LDYVERIFPYIQNPAAMIIANTIRPIKIGPSNVMRKIIIATITTKAIIPIIIDPIVPANPKINLYFSCL
jgi:hypothetical protein